MTTHHFKTPESTFICGKHKLSTVIWSFCCVYSAWLVWFTFAVFQSLFRRENSTQRHNDGLEGGHRQRLRSKLLTKQQRRSKEHAGTDGICKLRVSTKPPFGDRLIHSLFLRSRCKTSFRTFRTNSNPCPIRLSPESTTWATG